MARRPDHAPTHRPHPLTRAELARRVGRSRGAVTLALQGTLAAACLDGGRVDALHPDLVAFAAKHWGVGTDVLTAGAAGAEDDDAPPAAAKPKRSPPAAATTYDATVSVESLLDMTVRQITDRHGSLTACADFVDLRKDVAATKRLELQNAETEGRLIPRDLVATHVFGAIEAMNRRLLSDTAKSLALLITSAVKNDETLEQIETRIRDDISTHLRFVKTTAARVLRRRGKVESHDDIDIKRAS